MENCGRCSTMASLLESGMTIVKGAPETGRTAGLRSRLCAYQTAWCPADKRTNLIRLFVSGHHGSAWRCERPTAGLRPLVCIVPWMYL